MVIYNIVVDKYYDESALLFKDAKIPNLYHFSFACAILGYVTLFSLTITACRSYSEAAENYQQYLCLSPKPKVAESWPLFWMHFAMLAKDRCASGDKAGAVIVKAEQTDKQVKLSFPSLLLCSALLSY